MTRLYSSESFILKIASAASSADSNSMYAKPRIEPSRMDVSTVECRFEWYVSCKDTRIQESKGRDVEWGNIGFIRKEDSRNPS